MERLSQTAFPLGTASYLLERGGGGVGSVTKGWSKFSKGVARCPCVVGLGAPQPRVGRVGGNLLPTAV